MSIKAGIPAWGRRAVKRGTQYWGMSTHKARMLPSFLVIGAQRSGTTTLYRLLQEHPAVIRPRFTKGIAYFDLNYDMGWGWYRGHFPMEAAARLTTRVDYPVTFESSGYYLYHPWAAERIGNDLPHVKVVALLRDPVDRAYSAHQHEFKRGFETESFERAIELEPERLAGEVERLRADPSYQSFNHRHYSYAARGRYASQLDEYVRRLGRPAVYALDADRFFASPREEFAKLQAWLGLPVWLPDVVGKHNARPRDDLQPGLRRALSDAFEADDARLEAYLGEPPSWRL